MSEGSPGIERRRAPRAPINLPVRLRGRSPRGEPLEATAQTLNVSPLGAKMECAAEFARGTEVELQNPETAGSAVYRVVWAVRRPDQQWEMGVELVRGETAMWGTALEGEPG